VLKIIEHKMKYRLLLLLLLLGTKVVWAQGERLTGIPSDNVVHNYLTKAKEYATLYSGATEIPYNKRFKNHPYFESNKFVSGTLGYNHVEYKDILMRFDLFRNELTVVSPDKPNQIIVLNNKKFDYAILNGSTIVVSVDEMNSKEQFFVLLQNGNNPVVIKYNLTMEDEVSGRTIISSFRIQKQYAVYINDVPHTVKNKSSVIKLFPDKRKELNAFAKQRKLDFNDRFEQSIIAIVNHYESIVK
jgi:hypothetical protein